MKRIEFIAPVEAMRGNLSGKQDLLYAENDNKAYEGPVGATNYARNYAARFIGAKIAASGKKYFSVRTKSANHLTAKAKKAMALLGGTGALVGALLKAKSQTPYTSMYAAWVKAQEFGEKRSFRAFASYYIRRALEVNAQNIVLHVASVDVSFKNPWYDGSVTAGASVGQEILVKFWGELHTNGIYFYVDGMKGIATTGDTFAGLDDTNYNILSLAVDANDNVRLGDAAGPYLKNQDGVYQDGGDEITSNANFTTTDQAQE